MQILLSLLSGLAIAPLAAFLLRLYSETSVPGAPPALLPPLVVTALAIACGVLGRPKSSRLARLIGAVLIASPVFFVVLAPSLLPRWTWGGAFALFFVPIVGLTVISRSPMQLIPLLLGGGVGLDIAESFVVPHFGYLPIAIGAPLLLIAARWPSILPTDDEAPAPPTRWIDLLLAGIFVAVTMRLTTPFIEQHFNGLRYGHVAPIVIWLFGAGLGAAVIAMFRPRGWIDTTLRIVWLPLSVAVLYQTFRLVALAAPTSTFDADRIVSLPGFSILKYAVEQDNPTLTQLAIGQMLLSLAAVFVGLWIGHATQGRERATQASALAFGLAIGGVLGARCLESWEPAPLLGDLGRAIRHGPREFVDDQLVTPSGILRLARNPTIGDGVVHLLWQRERASRINEFGRLEQQEVLLPTNHANGGKLLVVGNALVEHRAAIGRSGIDRYVVAPTLPRFPVEEIRDESTRPLSAPFGPDEVFDVITLLSTPHRSVESARPFTEERIECLRAGLAPRGVFFAWIDLGSADAMVVDAIHLAMKHQFTKTRAWLAIDGYAGPFLGIEGGALPDRSSPFAVAIDLPLLTQAHRPSTWIDPVVETTPAPDRPENPLADATLLRTVADAIASDQPSVAALLRALAVHSENYYPIDNPNNRSERHRIVDDEAPPLLEAMKLDPNDPLVMNQIKHFVGLAATRKEYERMDQVLLPAIEYHPDDSGLRFVSGRASFDLLDYDGVIEEMEISLLENRDNLDALLILGISYSKLDPPDYPSAISALQEARDLDPENLDVLRALGMILADSGRGPEAIQYLERVSSARASDWEAKSKLLELKSE